MFDKKFFVAFGLFILINVGLYVAVFLGHSLVPFNRQAYLNGAHHYLVDPRVGDQGQFNFLRAITTWDAQWFLKIADYGYPKNPVNLDLNRKDLMDGISYAYFPAYPFLIRVINVFVHNVEWAAFIVVTGLLIINFGSLYFVLTKLFDQLIAARASLLFWTFPFGIVLRSAYAESLLLLFLIWFSYFLVGKRFLAAGILLGLLAVTKGNGWLLFIVFWWQAIRARHFSAIIFSVVPLTGWLLFNWVQTGNSLYFLSARGAWGMVFKPLATIVYSMQISGSEFIFLPMILGLFTKSLKHLGADLKRIAICLFLAPFLVFTLTFSRSQSISFPLAIYPATVLRGKLLGVVVVAQYILLVVFFLYFVNWYQV